jgi:hypothetical protein
MQMQHTSATIPMMIATVDFELFESMSYPFCKCYCERTLRAYFVKQSLVLRTISPKSLPHDT